MSAMSKAELEEKLREFVGVELGEPEVALDAVNEAMIRRWCEAMGDLNPVYTDAEAAKRSIHGGVVAPPSMLQAWMLRGLDMANPDSAHRTKQTDLHELLSEAGYTGVVATNCEQGYTRYLRAGDRLTSTTVIEDISDEKATALGIGYFINTREIFRDQNGEEVGWQTFRVLKFKPAEQPKAADAAGDGVTSRPTRLKPPLGHDNQWWWEGIDQGKLLIQKCQDCGRLRHPPRPMCPSCRSVYWDRLEASGRGSVHSYTVLHYPKFPGYQFPLACVLVDLDEGVRLVSNLIDCDHSDIRIGMAVQAVIETVDGDLKLPLFRPAKR